MRFPKISFVLHGRSDKKGRKSIYFRWSYNYVTRYTITPFKITPLEWDEDGEKIKKKSIMGPNGAAQINAWIEARRLKALNFIQESYISAETIPSFEELVSFLDKRSIISTLFFVKEGFDIIADEYSIGIISQGTHRAYFSALNKFKQIVGDSPINEITPKKLEKFKSGCQTSNMASQYLRSLFAVFGKILKKFNIKTIDNPIKKDKIVKIGNKKTLTVAEFELLYRYFIGTSSPHEKEVLRRFLLLCKGLRFSDSNLLKAEHLRSIYDPENKEELHYFFKEAKKTKIPCMLPISAQEILEIVKFNADGFLFSKVKVSNYNTSLKRISKQVIGREITSHYGRHFAGDFILNSPELGSIEDVKKVLGISDVSTAEVYAKRDNLMLLKNFNRAWVKINNTTSP